MPRGLTLGSRDTRPTCFTAALVALVLGGSGRWALDSLLLRRFKAEKTDIGFLIAGEQRRQRT